MSLRHRVLVLALVAALPWAVQAKEDLPQVIALKQRLAVLQADPQAGDLARYEQLQAQQAIAAVAEAKRKEQEQALYVADRRVEIAEITARTALARRDLDRLEATRNELLIEASRRDAARARQEAEQLRVQAQIQAEESDRLRQAAEQETLARQDAEAALTSVAGKQTAKLNAAQQKAAQLAREEAELVAGTKLPASRFEARGDALWQPWSKERVAQALGQGRPVMVDFTAAWCVTCQLNKRTALADPRVLDDFAAKNVQLLEADWTRRDPAITTALRELGRSGVPLYVLYPRDGGAPMILSEILSVSELRAAIARL